MKFSIENMYEVEPGKWIQEPPLMERECPVCEELSVMSTNQKVCWKCKKGDDFIPHPVIRHLYE